MNFSLKSALRLLILFFACSSLHGAELIEWDLYPIEYRFFDQEDGIKMEMVLPIAVDASLSKINAPSTNSVAVRVINEQLERLEAFYQLVDIEVYAFQEEGGVRFEIIEHLERKPTDRDIVSDQLTNTSNCFIKLDEQVVLRSDVTPKLTRKRNAHHIKYVKFFTKTQQN